MQLLTTLQTLLSAAVGTKTTYYCYFYYYRHMNAGMCSNDKEHQQGHQKLDQESQEAQCCRSPSKSLLVRNIKVHLCVRSQRCADSDAPL